eukprot:12721197-Alexandrium_andersonii.AAC.1
MIQTPLLSKPLWRPPCRDVIHHAVLSYTMSWCHSPRRAVNHHVVLSSTTSCCHPPCRAGIHHIVL